MRAAALISASIMTAAAPATAERAQFDLVTRNRIEIAAPAAAIWPRLFDLASWKPSVAGAVPVTGSGRAAGDVVAIHLAGGGDAPTYYLRTVEVEPERRIVWRIFNPADPSLVGFVTAELAAAGGGTVLTWDVYAAYDLPLPQGTSAEQLRAAIRAATLAKLDADNAALKALVEQAAQ